MKNHLVVTLSHQQDVVKQQHNSFSPVLVELLNLLTLWVYLLVNDACGECTDDPAQIQDFEGNDDHAHILTQFSVALWIDKMVGSFAANI